MKKYFLIRFWLLVALGTATAVFNSCGKDDAPKKKEEIRQDLPNKSYDEGVVINGIKWATCNVAAPGTFAAKPEYTGMFYQWNRKIAWPGTGDVSGWDSSTPAGETWERVNDPSPAGWRVPTLDEIEKLVDTDKVTNKWTIENGITGRRFTDKTSGNSLFLPAAGLRNHYAGALNAVSSFGYYWSSTQYDSDDACLMGFNSDDYWCDNNGNNCHYWNYYSRDYYYHRSFGFSVRCVADFD